MAKKATKSQVTAALALLATIVATEATNGFTYASEANVEYLVAEGLVEVNTTMKDEEGNFAVRSTDKGKEQIGVEYKSATPAASAKETFALEDATPPAVKGRGRTGTEMYPFAQMEVGKSFFVPVAADRPEPAKSLASTVSSANRRYAEAVPGEFKKDRKGNDVQAFKKTREYIVRARTAADEAKDGFNHGKDGARVYRTK